MVTGIPWNSATILSSYEKSVNTNRHVGINTSGFGNFLIKSEYNREVPEKEETIEKRFSHAGNCIDKGVKDIIIKPLG